jgi:hypothetical protein
MVTVWSYAQPAAMQCSLCVTRWHRGDLHLKTLLTQRAYIHYMLKALLEREIKAMGKGQIR